MLNSYKFPSDLERFQNSKAINTTVNPIKWYIPALYTPLYFSSNNKSDTVHLALDALEENLKNKSEAF